VQIASNVSGRAWRGGTAQDGFEFYVMFRRRDCL
jgi:hypothetical protein